MRSKSAVLNFSPIQHVIGTIRALGYYAVRISAQLPATPTEVYGDSSPSLPAYLINLRIMYDPFLINFGSIKPLELK
jgi:hypothetical protein